MAFALMQTFLIPALPTLQHDLNTSATWVTWTVTIYLITGAVSTPILGRLGDQHGKLRLLMISLTVFLIGSVGAIFAWNIGSLIAFRAVQGLGGAVFPLSFAIIRDHFPPARVNVAMGIVSAVLGVGGGVGIVASGLIVDHASWRWLFVVSALVVGAAIILVHRFVPESDVRASASVDVWGGVTLSAALICTLVALSEGERWGWSSPAILGLFAGGLLAFVAWVLVELRVASPMVDMRMMVRRPVLFTNITALMSGFALYMVWVILPAFYQLPRGLPDQLARFADYGFDTSVTVAGFWMLPTSLAILLAGPAAGMVGARRGSHGPLTVGMIMLALGSAGIALWHGAPWQPAAWFILCGVGIGASFAVMPKLIMDAVDITETGVATGMNTVVRTVGGVIGAQAGAVVLAISKPAGVPVPAESGFVHAFWIGAGAALIGAVAAWLVVPRGRRARPRVSVRAHAATPASGAGPGR